MSTLSDRLRAIVGTGLRSASEATVRLKPDTAFDVAIPGVPSNLDVAIPGVSSNVVSGFSRTVADLERVLGGEWQHRQGVSCFVVERRRDPETRYGREVLKAIAGRLVESSAEAVLVAGGAPVRPPFVFFDLETTGLSGGAGTYAFLVGCGTFDDDGGFLTRQFVLVRHGDERQLLQMVAAELSRASALVSFNGKSFDAPLIETRYLFHRLKWTGGRLPHLDVLHPARQFWGERVRLKADTTIEGTDNAVGGVGVHRDVRGVRLQPDRAAEPASCSLIALEEQLLGVRRTGDVPGFEIPSRYFQFVRTGDARPLAAVLEHNRLDLLSLAGLTARLLDLVRTGPGAARHAREALALGRVYARCGLDGRAREAYERAIENRDAPMAYTETSMVSIKMDALRSLALLSRRTRRYEDAAAYWRELLDVPACPPHVVREASEALAIHHEHRAHDLFAAKAFALRSLSGRAGIAGMNEAREPAWNRAVQHRLARIQRKIESLEP